MTNKKFIPISLVILFVLLMTLFIYRKPIQEQITASRNRIEIVNTIESFYKDYIQAINTNQNWPELVQKYTQGRASEALSMNAVFLLESASIGSQHLASIISPIIVRFYDLTPESAKALVDFEMKQQVVGNPNQIAEVQKLLVLERSENRWIITEDLDRSDRFNEWINQQNFPTAKLSY